MSDRLNDAISRLRCGNRAEEQRDAARISATAFRATVQERLRNLEREVGDLKGRLNGLIFLVVSTVITQVLLKLMQ